MAVLGGRRTPPGFGARIPRGAAGGRPPRLLAWIPVALLLAIGCAPPAAPITLAVDLPSPRAALALLDALPRHRSGYYQAPYPYERSYFGAAWWDTDGNGRGTRDDVLAAQLLDVTLNVDGNVASGRYVDPYVGLEVDYVRGRNEKDPVVVDHVVSLWEAWATGAWAWTPEQRLDFANDPLNLVATKAKYGLEVHDNDRTYLRATLSQC
ncbi:HNH endonuclease family protein [Demequina lutea]|uniref:GmrSD restriction endonucleases C-terminal domain-containing protein n=1 Tax=Demequina lutea TaxID=431489 RepID=A0A7Y9ZCL2_9MICO|nr:HNH endonuclease family protein [Demequina lutea]NYI42894.1 hypothetical protein [Demequina lutea]